MTHHTPEPWATDYRERHDGMFAQEVFDANGETIATLAWFPVDSGVGTTTNREANARRIAACVNAMAGIGDDNALFFPGNSVRSVISGMKLKQMELEQQRDHLQAQVDELLAAEKDHRRLVRELDVLMNGEAGAAQQASLCDLVAQVAKAKGGAGINKTTGETK